MVKYDRGHHARKSDLTRRERKKADARRRIYDSAIRLFRARGYEQTTVQEIAEAADVAKGTFFNYFPTKEHVLVAYHQDLGRQILDTIAGRSYATAEDAVQDALRECAAWAPADPVMARLIIRTIFGSDLLLHSDQRNEAQLVEWLTRQLAAGVERHELRRGLDIPFFISILMGALSSTVIEWVSGDRAFDLEGLLERKVRLLFDAVRLASTSRGSP